MNFRETSVTFECCDLWLQGIVCLPAQPFSTGVVIVVGGPQCRTGSHRQFTLIARELASRGIAVMRFDYRGMGDSEGEHRNFLQVEDDIRAAVDAFIRTSPTIKTVTIWGLCDGATAAAFYAPTDPRITCLVLLNPWVRTEETVAKTYLRRYYLHRLMQRDMWLKIARGKFNWIAAARSLFSQLARAFLFAPPNHSGSSLAGSSCLPLPERLYGALSRFEGRILFVISGNDITGQEFMGVAASSILWRRLMQRPGIEQRQLPLADHTFSRRAWREQVIIWTSEWIRKEEAAF